MLITDEWINMEVVIDCAIRRRTFSHSSMNQQVQLTKGLQIIKWEQLQSLLLFMGKQGQWIDTQPDVTNFYFLLLTLIIKCCKMLKHPWSGLQRKVQSQFGWTYFFLSSFHSKIRQLMHPLPLSLFFLPDHHTRMDHVSCDQEKMRIEEEMDIKSAFAYKSRGMYQKNEIPRHEEAIKNGRHVSKFVKSDEVGERNVLTVKFFEQILELTSWKRIRFSTARLILENWERTYDFSRSHVSRSRMQDFSLFCKREER